MQGGEARDVLIMGIGVARDKELNDVSIAEVVAHARPVQGREAEVVARVARAGMRRSPGGCPWP